MSINKFLPHVWLVPEDDADRQLAIGFIDHHQIDDRRVNIRNPAGGWKRVLDVFQVEYVPYLHKYPSANVVLLIDFDNDLKRRGYFEQHVPDEVKSRVFVLGTSQNPEVLRRELNVGLETIGRTLAQECADGVFDKWSHPHLVHNEPELQRLASTVKTIIFSL